MHPADGPDLPRPAHPVCLPLILAAYCAVVVGGLYVLSWALASWLL